MLPLKTAIAANRFGLGATPDDADGIGDSPEDWLLAQLGPARTRSATRPAADDRPESARVLEQITELRLARQALQSRRNSQAIEVDPESLREYGRFISRSFQTQATSGLSRAIATRQAFRERLVRFWQNHFAVSADKQPVGALAGLYADEAIRPHVTGNFRELLKAAVRHPAMLLYLDNTTSIGPGSLLGRRANRNRGAGLNENLAREILELHTLGVDGGYTQDDVIELARALTGWSISGAGAADRPGALARRLTGGSEESGPGEFSFRAAVHEPGSKTVLGQRFREDGVAEAEAILDFLALRPETARFLATKLARHFVADEPPPALVDRLAARYLEHEADLEAVYRELVAAPESWREPQAKYKTPEEFLISAMRAADLPLRPNTLVATATELGQRPLTPGSPAGWPDIAAHWNGGDALLKRIEWATTAGAASGDRIDAVARLDAVLGSTASNSTRTGIARAESGAQAVALLLSAPEFQWR